MKNILWGACALLLCSAAPQNGDSSNKPSSCQLLPQEMQQFSAALSAVNQKLFCSVFNEDQRRAAMALTTSLSPDMAVQKVAQDNGLFPKNRRPGGSCQVN